MKFSAELLLKDHSEEATFAFVSGSEETVRTFQPLALSTHLSNTQGDQILPAEGKLQLEITQRMPLDPSAVSIALNRSGTSTAVLKPFKVPSCSRELFTYITHFLLQRRTMAVACSWPICGCSPLFSGNRQLTPIDQRSFPAFDASPLRLPLILAHPILDTFRRVALQVWPWWRMNPLWCI